MANTRPDVVVPKGVWTNLYAATGIAVGTAVYVAAKGGYPCNLVISSSAPAPGISGLVIWPGDTEQSSVEVDAGGSGLWAFCSQGSAVLLVQE